MNQILSPAYRELNSERLENKTKLGQEDLNSELKINVIKLVKSTFNLFYPKIVQQDSSMHINSGFDVQ